MVRRRLLERVLDASRDGGGPIRDSREAVRRSILDSLRRIFRTVQGDASTDPLYGLPDVGGISRNLPEATEQMREAIVRAVEHYEPRLQAVRVLPVPDAQGRILRFDIMAQLRDDEDDGGAFSVATRLETSGHLVVEG